MPLNLAYKAARLADANKADGFLWNLRHATIVHSCPTTHFDEILQIARQSGIDESKFIRHYKDGTALAQLQKDLALKQSLGIYSLPATLFEYGEKSTLVRGVMGYDDFARIIENLSDGKRNLTLNLPKFRPNLLISKNLANIKE